MLLEQLRKSPKSLESVRTLLRSDDFQKVILPILLELHPGRRILAFDNLESSSGRERESVGYEKAIGVMLSILEEPKQIKTPKSTYSEPKQQL